MYETISNGDIHTARAKHREVPAPSEPEPEKFEVDLSKPLVFQVGHLGDRYDEWIHQPIVTSKSPLFFENKFIEIYLSRTSWWVVPSVWCPVVLFLLRRSLSLGVAPSVAGLSFLLGLLLWTLVEYVLHRFLFHLPTTTYWTNTIHYLIHGCHHKHPMDHYRLVFPPVLAAIFCLPLWGLASLLFPPPFNSAVFAGGLFGYVCYDMTHYFCHHGYLKSFYPQQVKKYHLAHHFKHPSQGYGVTSPIWDHVFGTQPPFLEQTKQGREKSQ